MRKNQVPVYAVLRHDLFLDEFGGPEETVRVKEIVYDQGTAEREVERLNALRSDDGCVYWWQATRLYPPGSAVGSDA